MFRLTLRELLLLTTLAAVCIAWRTETNARERIQQAQRATRAHAERLRASLELAEEEYLGLVKWIRAGMPATRVCLSQPCPYPDWELAKQPIP